MNIIFAGTPEFALPALESLIETHNVMAVFTQPDRRAGRGKKLTPPPVKVLAEQHNIPVYQPENLNSDQTFFHQLIDDLKADAMVVVAYGILLPQSILDSPKHGCLNIHASILPRWRGAAPIQRAIQYGDTQTGVSIMQMQLGLDTGPVFQTLTLDIEDSDTSASLHEKLAKLGATGITQTLNAIENKTTTQATEQDDSLANYAKKITKQEANINWERSAKEIDCQVRAFNPWPICQFEHKENRIRCWKTQVVTDESTISDVELIKNRAPGTIVAISASELIVACGDGFLKLLVLQKNGGKPIPTKEFCLGYSFSLGDQLN